MKEMNNMRFTNWKLSDLIDYLKKAQYSSELRPTNEYSEPIVSGEVDIVCGKREKKDGDET